MVKGSLSGKNWAPDEQKLKEQIRILKHCAKSGLKLDDVLSGKKWSYDDLRYENGKIPDSFDCKIHRLSEFTKKPANIPMVSFFSGAGGLDLGFETAGYSHVALVEKNELFCNTLRLNRPKWTVLGPPNSSGDVSDFEQMKEQLSGLIQPNFDGVFVGGPPCQPFSIASNQRFNKNGENFKRIGFSHETNGNLLFDYINLIKYFKPKAFLIENVPGLIEVDGGEQLQRAYGELKKAGYDVNDPLILMASEHYVPQQRVRLFIVGNRNGKAFKPPRPNSERLCCGPIFDVSLDDVANHVTRNHTAESILRYMKLDYGSRDKLGRVDRLDPLQPSKTVIAGGTSGGGRSHLHPYIPRTMSVRESARLQTFPDDFVFTGPVARQFTQVGNAVPPVLAVQLAIAIKSSFFS